MLHILPFVLLCGASGVARVVWRGVQNHAKTVRCKSLTPIRYVRFWMSDEYGPYIYRFDSSSGALLQAFQPPAAILPMNKDGNVNFTSEVDPATGRAGNRGSSISPVTSHNFALSIMMLGFSILCFGETVEYLRSFSPGSCLILWY